MRKNLEIIGAQKNPTLDEHLHRIRMRRMYNTTTLSIILLEKVAEYSRYTRLKCTSGIIRGRTSG